MPKLRSAAPTFLVADVGATAKWYALNLGFTASFFPKAPPFVYASLQRDAVEIMLLRVENYRKPEITRAGGAWDAYIRMEGVREFYEEVRQQIEVKSELIKRPYGDTEFEVADPNGYVLVFSE
jgi:Glyoxalase/Bleomycin resistance protein/Dioxygenase superfamily